MFSVFSRRSVVSSSARTFVRGLEEFWDVPARTDSYPAVGRAWLASELRTKSASDLQSLWALLLKEKNLLFTQREHVHMLGRRWVNPSRWDKVKLSMNRIQQVLSERRIERANSKVAGLAEVEVTQQAKQNEIHQ
ncbi:mitochondrial ribosomal protein L29 (bL29m) [Andalucia godoyi]|uniref:Large ribosomal subunit protein uL29m n=1 Tax=Andalucia godoyi TaxID=505711 RepID=A0A8K0F4J3_ANDGO|nr:mitochondrial ribosomal protein L29 (bL29m) [Andalucia godoyi]|eukprot:ANDGO_04382.mRNA.1 mitochondrial ribosomal protein L29 (bL29m)